MQFLRQALLALHAARPRLLFAHLGPLVPRGITLDSDPHASTFTWTHPGEPFRLPHSSSGRHDH